MSLSSDDDGAYVAATAAVAELAERFADNSSQHSAAIVVSARPHSGSDVVIDATQLRLTRTALSAPIADYVGQLQAPQFYAAAYMAIAAAAGRIPADLAANASSRRDVVIAEHFRAVAAEWRMRAQSPVHTPPAAAAANTLWPVELYCGDTLLVFVLTELLPRIDSTVLPRSAGTAALEMVKEHARAVLPDCVALWREAILGTPGGQSSPSVSDWISHAQRWNSLMQSAFPTARWRDTEEQGGGFTAADRILATHPCRSDHAHECRQNLSSTTIHATAQAADMLALVQEQPSARPHRTGTAQRTLHAGGAETGDRRVRYRAPGEPDMRARSTFLAELADAGHRSPRLTPTAVPFPSGRLHTRRLIARNAQIAAGRTPTAMPWTALRPHPRLAVRLALALVIDSSATMLRWANHTATLGWAAAHAVAELGGVCAVWGFAGEAFPIIEAGAAPGDVPVVEDNYAGSAGSITAMRSALDAIRGCDGHRVLVVVTDGLLPDPVEVCDAVDDFVGDGIQVVWVLRDQTGPAVRPSAAVVVEPDGPQRAAVDISRAILAGLSAAE